ncbi:MAG TPA: argininosuccinate lyase [Pyrinomonadaceae bacterium]|nr:argininosuccinate lyase [Acidobacteriota bacterium]HQZ96296.1 argininosuccinate lyase [Pyrinomonadaceae bacterium]
MTKSGQLWGGRFTEKPDETFAEFNDSFRFDKRLFAADVRGCIAHANGLKRARVITNLEAVSILEGLDELIEHAASDPAFFLHSNSEDVHSFIEGKLIDLIGDTGRKLHTGRSRNDQVATAFRLWLRDELDAISSLIHLAQSSLVSLAERHREAVLPGYTHLQRAQPVMWAHWCLAYFEMLKRDSERLADARKRVNILPLGSAALAGTSFPIDRESVAAELRFEGVSANSLDAVSDRDFAVEFTAACSLIMVHLSRLAEDLIIYCSNEFGFVTLSDAVSSGSSLMPQKKNPDALELLRGKAGRVFGHQMGLLATIKGLPLAYNKDMQEDKEAVFDTVDTVSISLRAASIVLDNATLNEERALAAATKGYLNATELADYLVKKGVPFRTGHEIVGRAVLYAISEGKELHELSVEQLKEFSSEIGEDVADALSLGSTLGAKDAIGGTSPSRVTEALTAARAFLDK